MKTPFLNKKSNIYFSNLAIGLFSAMALIFVENRTFPFARELTRLAKVGWHAEEVIACCEDPAAQIMLV